MHQPPIAICVYKMCFCDKQHWHPLGVVLVIFSYYLVDLELQLQNYAEKKLATARKLSWPRKYFLLLLVWIVPFLSDQVIIWAIKRITLRWEVIRKTGLTAYKYFQVKFTDPSLHWNQWPRKWSEGAKLKNEDSPHAGIIYFNWTSVTSCLGRKSCRSLETLCCLLMLK